MLLDTLSSPDPQEPNIPQTNADPWSDVFETDLPILSETLVRRDEETPFREHSDVPRLQTIHSNAGYRDGITDAKGRYLQAGFDEGYGLGGEIGRAVGWILGSLEGVVAAASSTQSGRKRGHATVISASSSVDADANQSEDWTEYKKIQDQAKEALLHAKRDLDAGRVFGEEYITDEGVWKWDVKDEDFVFKDIAMKHPLLMRWRKDTSAILKELVDLSSPNRLPKTEERNI
jgi:hypothetical protein